MKQIELYVPICRNDGQRVEAKCWDWLRDTLALRFGGFSKYLVDGFYRGQQTAYAESCFVYRIVTADHPGLSDLLADLAHAVKKHWQQESVLYVVSDIDATFV